MPLRQVLRRCDAWISAGTRGPLGDSDTVYPGTGSAEALNPHHVSNLSELAAMNQCWHETQQWSSDLPSLDSVYSVISYLQAL